MANNGEKGIQPTQKLDETEGFQRKLRHSTASCQLQFPCHHASTIALNFLLRPLLPVATRAHSAFLPSFNPTAAVSSPISTRRPTALHGQIDGTAPPAPPQQQLGRAIRAVRCPYFALDDKRIQQHVDRRTVPFPPQDFRIFPFKFSSHSDL